MSLVENIHELFSEPVEMLPKNPRSDKILEERAIKKKMKDEAEEL